VRRTHSSGLVVALLLSLAGDIGDADVCRAMQAIGLEGSAGARRAQAELSRLNVPLTADAFVTRAGRGDQHVVELFIQSGIGVDSRNTDGFSALIWAAGQGRARVVDFLLSNGANVNASSADGTTALMAAAGEGRIAVVTRLIARGANIEARRADGHTALIRAAAHNQRASVATLLHSGAAINGSDREGRTALIYAATNGNEEEPTGASLPLIGLLLSRGADVNHAARDGSTGLMWAARKGEERVVRALLAGNADVNVADLQRRTPLMHAILGTGSPAVAKVIIEAGAAINARDAHGSTALSMAAKRRSVGMLNVLLGSGADPNLPAADGTTPLMIAAKFARATNVQALLGKGANPAAKDAKGRMAADIAVLNHQTEILSILRNATVAGHANR
jgi:ankyrin repeat protein